MSIRQNAFTALVFILTVAGPLRAEAPLSAINWLSRSVTAPAVQPPAAATNEPGVTTAAMPDAISVEVIGAPRPDAVGLFPISATGLPRTLWGMTPTDELVSLLQDEPLNGIPALQDLLLTLLLAELDPPFDADRNGTLLLARIDRLLELGALDQAAALLEQTGRRSPELFRRAFDVALLLGEETEACNTLRELPEVAPTFPTRIFCLARNGDWNAAALTLHTGQALGFISEEEENLLSRFLDPDLFEGEDPLPAPSRPSPLVWRMHEAIGEHLPTSTLPIAFAYAELRPSSGWKAQLEAAERLARQGALSPNRLLGLYTERLPAASGGIWDRVEALQRFDTALTAGDPSAVARALPEAWARMTEVELEIPFAILYAEALARLPLRGEAEALAFRIGLLSSQYEAIAQKFQPRDAEEDFLIGLARGDLSGQRPFNRMTGAIQTAFQDGAAPVELQKLADENRLGEAILRAIRQIEDGAAGEVDKVAEGLTLLRRVGLEDTARRAALQLMLLERRG